MEDKLLRKIIHSITHLRRDYKNGGAPHKPILVLSIIALYEKDLVKGCKIFLTPELVSIFKKIWNDLVITKHICNITLPFYHLKTAPFWKLISNFGYEAIINSKIQLKGFKNLNDAVNYALLDSTLCFYLKNKNTREIIKQEVINTYFPHAKNTKTPFLKPLRILNELENEILKEPSEIYQQKIKAIQNTATIETYEEEIFIRSAVFKRMIAKIYDDSCAITGLKIDSIFTASMIDACHIKPFSQSYDDTISNGIALSPTLHRAFDRGIISIDQDYKVMVSNKIKETSNHKFSIQELEGEKIYLPKNSQHLPNQKNLEWHRKNIFK